MDARNRTMYEPIDVPVLAKDLEKPRHGGSKRTDWSKYFAQAVITAVCFAIVLSNASQLAVPVKREVQKASFQTLTTNKLSSEEVQFRVPEGAVPGGLVNIVPPGHSTPRAVTIPEGAKPGEMMTVQLPPFGITPELSEVPERKPVNPQLAGKQAEKAGEGKIMRDVEHGNLFLALRDFLSWFLHYFLVVLVVFTGRPRPESLPC